MGWWQSLKDTVSGRSSARGRTRSAQLNASLADAQRNQEKSTHNLELQRTRNRLERDSLDRLDDMNLREITTTQGNINIIQGLILDLSNIAVIEDTSKHTESLRDGFLRRTATLATGIQRRNLDTTGLQRLLDGTKLLINDTRLKTAASYNAAFKILENQYKENHLDRPPEGNVLRQVRALAEQVANLNTRKKTLADSIKRDIDTIKRNESREGSLIEDVINFIHDDNFPQALTRLNELLQMERSVNNAEEAFANLRETLEILRRAANEINTQIGNLIRYSAQAHP